VGSFDSSPFLWTKQKGMQDLNNLIPPKSGWVLEYAASINNRGQITGSGTINGETHAFLLTPISSPPRLNPE
jgi:probable HAF family extracellular repeat protein